MWNLRQTALHQNHPDDEDRRHPPCCTLLSLLSLLPQSNPPLSRGRCLTTRTSVAPVVPHHYQAPPSPTQNRNTRTIHCLGGSWHNKSTHGPCGPHPKKVRWSLTASVCLQCSLLSVFPPDNRPLCFVLSLDQPTNRPIYQPTTVFFFPLDPLTDDHCAAPSATAHCTTRNC